MRRLSFLKRPKVFVPLLIILLVLAGFVSAIINLNSPAEGTVVNSGQDSSQGLQPASQANKQYSDNVLSFEYPGKFQVKPSQSSAGFIDTVNLIMSQRHDEYVSIGVYKSTFQNDSGIRFRNDRPDQYKKIKSTAAEEVFSKTDSLEYTGFIQIGDKVVSISFTSAGPKDMSSDYQLLANSLRLKQ
jgi:hypothetical protein